MVKTNALKISQIKEMALYFRDKYNIKSDSYFPIFEVIYDFFAKGLLNFEIVKKDSKILQDEVVGKYDYNTNTIYVLDEVVKEYYNNVYRSNFTLAHEFFHYVQAKILNFSFEMCDECKMYENCEWQANEFAGQLLITQEYTNLDEKKLSEMFHVSVECALTRKVKKLTRLDKYNKIINKNPDLTDKIIETLIDSYKDLSLVNKELANSNLEKNSEVLTIASYIVGLIYPCEKDIIDVINCLCEYVQLKNAEKKKYYYFAVCTMLCYDGLSDDQIYTYLLNKYGYDLDCKYIRKIEISYVSSSTNRLHNVIKSWKYILKDRSHKAILKDDNNMIVYSNNKLFELDNYMDILNIFENNMRSHIYLKALVNKYRDNNDLNNLRIAFSNLMEI